MTVRASLPIRPVGAPLPAESTEFCVACFALGAIAESDIPYTTALLDVMTALEPNKLPTEWTVGELAMLNAQFSLIWGEITKRKGESA